MCFWFRVSYVVRGRDLVDEVAADERNLLEDVLLHSGDAGGVEDDGEESNATKSTSLHAAIAELC